MSSEPTAMSGDEPNATMSFDEDVPYPDFTQLPAVWYAFVAAFLLAMLLAVVGNAVVCFTVFTNRKMHTAVNYYIVNLAACDFMVGGFVLPVKLLELTSPAHWGLLNDGLCTAMMYLQTIFVFASVLTLVAICIERYMAVLHPFESRMHQTKARAKRIVLAAWLAPCLVATPFLYPAEALSNTLRSDMGEISRLSCFTALPEEFRRGYYTFLFVFIYLLPLLFISGTCLRVARCLLRDIPVHRQGSIRRQEANRRKVAKMVLMVVLAFAVSWTPYFLVSLVTQYSSNFMERENFFFTMLCINLFAFFNSCVNPFIYAAMSTRFRNGFRRCFRFLCLCAPRDQRQPARGRKVVTFRCQIPKACMNTQSSSDGNSQSETRQHSTTTVSVEQNGGNKRFAGSAFLKTLLRRKKQQQQTSQPRRPPRGEDVPMATLPVSTVRLDRKGSASAGDVSALRAETRLDGVIGDRRWNSCLNVNGVY